MEYRAERLYRLRAIDRRSGRGPAGELLRLLLFLADGWGWEYVRQTCIRGYRITLRLATRGVSNRLRGRELTLDNLWMFAEDIAEDQHRPQAPTQAQVDCLKMTLGLLLFGTAPDGAMGTIEQVVGNLLPRADQDDFRKYKQLLPLTCSLLNIGESEAIKVLESNVSDDLLQRAVCNFRGLVRGVRSGFRKKSFEGKDKLRSSNPLTAFGTASHFRFQQSFRRMAVRATPAQCLGAHFAQCLVISHGEQQIAKVRAFMLKWLTIWLSSEACNQWIDHVEREVRGKT